MKILYILPDETVKSGGNWVTVTRLVEGFKKKGIIVDIAEAKDVTKGLPMKYDVIHAFHAFKSLVKVSDLLIDMDKNIVVSFTGTDLKQLQEMEDGKEGIVDLLNKIKTIVVFHSEAKEELIKEGIAQDKIKVIPQTPMLIERENILNKQYLSNFINPSYITFLFAGGIRKVKAPLETIEMFSSLVERIENIRLVIIGPILEKDLGEEFKEKIKEKNWATYLGEVSHKDAQGFILKSDIVLNASFSEGMPNTLLEAKYMGKPILARDVAGNRAIITHGVNGFLFKDKKEFEYYATKLVKDSKLRKEMGLLGIKAKNNYNWIQEIDMYEKIYLD
ncbi:glycosyltransferase [Tissierella creatinophila]|nr:glycosyltransferase [Tissierella creatinophila]